jgi:hypothetical protein
MAIRRFSKVLKPKRYSAKPFRLTTQISLLVSVAQKFHTLFKAGQRTAVTVAQFSAKSF